MSRDLARDTFQVMKTTTLFACLLLAGCTTAPKGVYVHPEKFNCDLIIPTIWDGNYPVKNFEHEIVLGQVYHDHYGMQYMLVETDVPNVFSLQVDVVRP